MQNADLEAWLTRLLNLHHQAIDMGLGRVRKVLQNLNQQLQLHKPAPLVLSVAGTNGKGSSVAMLVSILQAAGYQVGSYTSPHLLSFNERIQINQQNLTDAEIVQAFELVEQARADISLTFFEFTTLAALVAFKQKNLDVVVLEVGLGGRLDAVNVLDADAVLITAIDVDHADWLSADREQIGLEKAGIMRAHKLAVCSDPNPPAKLIEYGQQLQANLQLLNLDFSYVAAADDWQFKSQSQSLQNLAKPGLVGDFQLQNAAGVLALLVNLAELKITPASINQGLQAVRHPGRLEQRQYQHQAWLFDVAHNPQAAAMLAKYLQTQAQNSKPRIAIFSALNDKDFTPMIADLKPWVDYWVIADLQVERATSVQQLQQALSTNQIEPGLVIKQNSIVDAVQYVQQTEFVEVLVFGSFYTVAQALEQLDG